jgi:hypothetical protein
MFVWVIKCLSLFLIPFRSSNTPLYPQSVASQGVCPLLLTLLLFSLQTHIWVYQGAWERVREFRGSHLGIPGQNDIWVLVPWLGTKYTIRGKVVASPKSELWWILWVRVCPWFIRALTCSNFALTNLLFGLWRFVWMIELLVNLLSPISELQHALLPPKCCELGNAPQFFLPLFSPLDSQLNPLRSLGVHQLEPLGC